jgi:hypothetical protein
VNTNGNANNNNARNSNGLAPDFATLFRLWSNTVVLLRMKETFAKGEMFPVDKTQNRSFDAFARTLLAWWEDIVLNPISCVKAKQFRRTLYYNCTKGE